MKNRLSSIFNSGNFLLILFAGFLFISCENFLSGGDFKLNLEKDIAYANAKSISVLISPEVGHGVTEPSGKKTEKIGYPFEISFTAADSYSFIKWIAVSSDDFSKVLEDAVVFYDEKSVRTSATIKLDSDKIRIVPLCTNRIAVEDVSPSYSSSGVSRDRSITVEFSKVPSKESFIFSKDEIPAGATDIRKNTTYDYYTAEPSDEVWSFVSEGEAYFKNISITNADGISLAEHFLQPSLNKKLLTIEIDKNNPIKLEAGTTLKTIIVTISAGVTDEDGVKMGTEKSWRYQIKDETDEKTTVNLTSESEEGSVYLSGTRDYNLDVSQALVFTESADYQFLKWKYDSSYVYVAEPYSKDTTFTPKKATEGNSTTQIEAVCAPRLRVTSFSPENDSSNPAVSKNSSITITFSQNLPTDKWGQEQLDNIQIAIGGTSVKSSFLAPTVNGNTVIFAADKNNMLDVSAGQTKTVTVSIPADFYYVNDGMKVTYGGNGRSFDYKIDSSTIEKTQIVFTSQSGSGTITSDGRNTNNYSIGEEVPLSFALSEGWVFNGWKIISSEDDDDIEEKIVISDKNALSTKLIINDAVSLVTIQADVSECLKISSKTPLNTEVQKDSSILLEFNKPLSANCSSLLNKIRISSEGNSLDSYYRTRTLSDDGKKVTIENTSYFAVEKGSKKDISVTVPSDLYYIDEISGGNTKINLTEETFSFTVNYTTIEKAKITYEIIDGETLAAFSSTSDAAALNCTSYEEYNIGEEISLSCNVKPDYQFYGWKIIDEDEENVSSSVIAFKDSKFTDTNAVLVFKQQCEEIKIQAVIYKRPSISTASVEPYNSNSATEFAKNTPIVLTFSHAIDSGKDDIEVEYSVLGFRKNTYFSTLISDDRKTVTLKPIKMLPLENSSETVTVTVPYDKVYYYAADGKTKITPADEDFSWSYRVNASTMTKTTVRFDTTDASGSAINVNDAVLSSGTTQDVNVEQVLNLEYPLAEGYKFSGWKITSATSGYTVNPEGYVASGTITVKSGINNFFVLEIDSSNPYKAKATSFDAIGAGTDSYGLMISAKDVLLPKIVDVYPPYDNAGYPQDTSIKIYFNKKMNLSDFSDQNGFIKNITITCGNTNLLDSQNGNQPFYKSPYLEDSEKTLVIPTVRGNYFINNQNETKDIAVTVNLKGLRDAIENIAFEQESYSFVYKESGRKDSVAPVFSILNVARTQTDALNGTNLISMEEFSYYADRTNYHMDSTQVAKNIQNHHVNKVWIYFDADDVSSGIKKFEIEEQLIRKTNGEVYSGYVYDGSFNEESNLFVNNSDENNFSRIIEYTFNELEDGIVRLKFYLTDFAGNVTTKIVDIVKDTECSASVQMKDEDVKLYDGSELILYQPLVRGGQSTLPYATDIAGNNYYDTFGFSDINDLSRTCSYISFEYGPDESHMESIDFDDITYTVKTGYSNIDYGSNIGLIKCMTVPFYAEPDKNYIIKTVYTDAAGNTSSFTRTLSRLINVVSFTQGSIGGNLAWSFTLNSKPENYGYYYYVYEDEDGNKDEPELLYNYLSSSSTSDMKNSFRLNNTDLSIEDLPDGIHCIYFMPRYGLYTYLGKPFKIYKHDGVISTGYGDTLTESDIPSFTVTADEPELNTGVRNIHVELQEDFDYNSDYTYSIYYEGCAIKDGNKVTKYQTSFTDFSVPTEYGNYIFKVIVYNQAGEKIESEEQILDLSYDNVPPEFSPTLMNIFSSLSKNKGMIAMSISDRSGLLLDASGHVVVKYLLSDNTNLLGNIDWDNNPSVKSSVYTGSGFEIIPDGSYPHYIYCYVKDNNGNYKEYKEYFGVTELNVQPQVSVADNSFKTTIECPSNYSHNMKFSYSYLDGTNWSSTSTYTAIKSDNLFTYSQSLTDARKHSFVKIQPWNTAYTGRPAAWYGRTLYAYAGYYYETLTCDLKDFVCGSSGLSIFADQPCFAHIMYSTRNLGDAVVNWLEEGFELAPVMKQKSFTYSYGNAENVPSGCYYTIVVHYADGTALMCEVKQK